MPGSTRWTIFASPACPAHLCSDVSGYRFWNIEWRVHFFLSSGQQHEPSRTSVYEFTFFAILTCRGAAAEGGAGSVKALI